MNNRKFYRHHTTIMSSGQIIQPIIQANVKRYTLHARDCTCWKHRPLLCRPIYTTFKASSSWPDRRNASYASSGWKAIGKQLAAGCICLVRARHWTTASAAAIAAAEQRQPVDTPNPIMHDGQKDLTVHNIINFHGVSVRQSVYWILGASLDLDI